MEDYFFRNTNKCIYLMEIKGFSCTSNLFHAQEKTDAAGLLTSVPPNANRSAVVDEKKTGKDDQDDEQDAEDSSKGSDKVSQGSNIVDQRGVLRGIALDGLAQTCQLFLNSLYLNGLIQNLRAELSMVRLYFGEPVI
jgi:hypothetical protein